jgi:hypothetical protein
MLLEKCKVMEEENNKISKDLAQAVAKPKAQEEEKGRIPVESQKVVIIVYNEMPIEKAKENKFYKQVIDCKSTSLDLRSIHIFIIVEGRGITDDDARAIAVALKTNTTITDLYLGKLYGGSKHILMLIHIADGNNIGDEGAIAIANALTVNKTLTVLELGIFNAFNNSYYYSRK